MSQAYTKAFDEWIELTGEDKPTVFASHAKGWKQCKEEVIKILKLYKPEDVLEQVEKL